MDTVCPTCGNASNETITGVEYSYGHPERYDGISEWNCRKCNTRWGRWSGKVLKANEYEKRWGGK